MTVGLQLIQLAIVILSILLVVLSVMANTDFCGSIFETQVGECKTNVTSTPRYLSCSSLFWTCFIHFKKCHRQHEGRSGWERRDLPLSAESMIFQLYVMQLNWISRTHSGLISSIRDSLLDFIKTRTTKIEDEIFKYWNSARVGTNVISAGKRDSRHSVTSFSENVIVAEKVIKMSLVVLSLLDPKWA